MQMFGKQFFENKKPAPKKPPPVEIIKEKELTVVNEYTHEDTVTTTKTLKSSERFSTRESNRRKPDRIPKFSPSEKETVSPSKPKVILESSPKSSQSPVHQSSLDAFDELDKLKVAKKAEQLMKSIPMIIVEKSKPIVDKIIKKEKQKK